MNYTMICPFSQQAPWGLSVPHLDSSIIPNGCELNVGIACQPPFLQLLFNQKSASKEQIKVMMSSGSLNHVQ
jgi:hypothetical protein